LPSDKIGPLKAKTNPEKKAAWRLCPAPRQEECADASQREMHDVKERVGQINRKKDDEEGVGIEKEEVGILEQGLPVVQIRVPKGQGAVAAHLLNQASGGIGVIEDVADEKHGRSEDHLREHGQRAEGEDGRKRQVNAVKRHADFRRGVGR